jgi:uncharacterized membrane protein (UPF0127 family)
MEVLCRLSYSGGIGDDSNVVRRVLWFAFVSALVACSSGAMSPSHQGQPVVTFVAEGSAALQITVEVADSSEERANGLMGVTELPSNAGMAFVWGEPTTAEFWMKDTLIPLSVAFVDDSGRIVTIRDMSPCTADPCPTYGAASPYVLAVETNEGFFDRHDIGVGDRAELGARLES